METSEREKALEEKIKKLEAEIEALKKHPFSASELSVSSYPEVEPLFKKAHHTVESYFKKLKIEVPKANIEIDGQRYILLRASSLSVDFFKTIYELYSDKGEDAAFKIGQNFLFDISHVIGMEDANNFGNKMNLEDSIDQMSAGPVHFAFTGWAFVEVLDDSFPTPGDDFYLHYIHHHSFEANSWISSNIKSDKPVCIMNAGYSSGWCEESFGTPLTAVEIKCRACGDEHCEFIMAPPHKIEQHLETYSYKTQTKKVNYTIPSFFDRKEVEKQIQAAKEKAIASDQAKTEFLANMSHEIRTPLNTILGYADLLEEHKLPVEVMEYIDHIQQGSQYLMHIVNDVLDLSKIEAGQVLVNPQPTSIKSIFKHTHNAAKSLIGDKSEAIELNFYMDPYIHDIVVTDAVKLQQILFNLLSNAIKFTDNGSISCRVSLRDNELYFSVEDTGIGIPKEKQETIFENFKQVDGSYTREYGGTGLGLAITKKLVELMGGTIQVFSQVSKGSTFLFSLPYKPTKASLQKEEKQNLSKVIQPANILLADDNSMNLKLSSHILKKAGYDVMMVHNGKEAIEARFAHRDIDLILMDIQMPVMDGLEAVKRIRKWEKESGSNRHTPIIALTAHAMQEDKNICLAVGCDAYLTKPTKATVLLEEINRLLHQYKN